MKQAMKQAFLVFGIAVGIMAIITIFDFYVIASDISYLLIIPMLMFLISAILAIETYGV